MQDKDSDTYKHKKIKNKKKGLKRDKTCETSKTNNIRNLD